MYLFLVNKVGLNIIFMFLVDDFRNLHSSNVSIIMHVGTYVKIPEWKWSESESHSIMSDFLWPPQTIQSMEFSRPEYWSGLQGIFPTQGLNPDLPHSRQIFYQLSHKGRPRILEWVAYLFSNRSSWSRNRTGVSCTAGRFFTNWAIRETLTY